MIHIFHAKALTLSTINAILSVSMAAFFLVMIFTAFIFPRQPDLFLQLRSRCRAKRRHDDILPVAQTIMRRWLALFEQSPNFIKPA